MIGGKPHSTLCRVVFFVTMLLSATVAAQIKVTGGQPAAVLAQKLAGQGVTVLNPVLTCALQANGLFTVVSSNLGLDSGIVLTTGRAASILGSYGVNGPSNVLASFDNGQPGDARLQALAGRQTMDACKLEFDVIPAGDTVSIDYVFSSEEYISAVCGPYNDAFAFFISGPGITGADNMALVPGTTIPVTINTINNGIPGTTGNIVDCTSMGPGSPFTAYYQDNATGTTLTHKGLTTVLKAMHVVNPCDTYHFAIAIADAGNAKYDSGVFLEAGSLKTGDYKVQAVPLPVAMGTAPICIKGCLPGTFRVKNPKPRAVPQTIRFATSGTAISGVDYMPMSDSVVIPAYALFADVTVYGIPTAANGPRQLDITIYSPGACGSNAFAADSASITIYDTLHISVAPADTLVCGNDSVQLRVQGDDIYTYSWSPVTALSNKDAKEPIAFPTDSTTYTVTAFMPGTSCPFRSATATFAIRPTADVELLADTQVCYNTVFQFTPRVSPLNSFYSYRWVGPNGYTSTQLLPIVPAATAANDGIYRLVVTNDTNGCKAAASIAVSVYIPPPPAVVSPAFYCLNSLPVALSAVGTNLRWYAPDAVVATAAPAPPTNSIASFQYYVSDIANNCESPRAEIQVRVEKCCDGDIFIPSAFTPNNDGLNDVFRPRQDFSYFIKNISIYDRWGQVVYSGNIGSWDGSFNSTPAPVGVYFYKIIFGCILGGTTERSGDITLIR